VTSRRENRDNGPSFLGRGPLGAGKRRKKRVRGERGGGFPCLLKGEDKGGVGERENGEESKKGEILTKRGGKGRVSTLQLLGVSKESDMRSVEGGDCCSKKKKRGFKRTTKRGG